MKFNQNILLSFVVVLSLLCGSMATYIWITLPASTEKKLQADEFKNLSSILVELSAASSSGVSQVEFSDLTRKYNVAYRMYKIATSPVDKEAELLDNIEKSLRRVSDIWRIDISYPCNGKKISQECLEKYVKDFREANPNQFDMSLEQHVKNFRAIIEKEGDTLNDLKSAATSWNLSVMSLAISDFFEFHEIDL